MSPPPYLPPALLFLLEPGITATLAQDGALQGRRVLARQAEGGHLEGGGQAEGAFGADGGGLRAVCSGICGRGETNGIKLLFKNFPQ